ncbi:LysR family transcriptional regulator [Allorhizobium undicola]|uniref:LysR family transcriptional regulator n=1 Tax=Allorhizobium undicola TaxID=78527 RepID=UPI003D3429CD
MKYRGLDLNLLVALDALLRLQSVSRAAGAVNVTQPAMSAALARLRQYFGDPLLITRNGKSILSPLAETLAAPVANMLRSIDATIIAPPSFDPDVADRDFSLLAADTVVAGLLAKPLQQISQLAPFLRLEIATPSGNLGERLEAGEVDLVVVPEIHCSPDHPRELLVEEEHCVIACAKSWDGDAITLEDYAAADHIEVFVRPMARPYLPDRLFARYGVARRIAVKLDNFSLVPFFISGTRRLATLPGMTAELYGSFCDLKLFEPPIAIPRVRLVMQWHSRLQDDPGLAWLRARIRLCLADVHAQHKPRLYRLALETI